MPRRHVWVGVVVVASLTLAQGAVAESPGERVEAARKLLAANKFADAAKAVDAALALGDNDEQALIGLYEVSGISNAQTKQAQKARLAFQRVVSLDPSHKLTGKWPPKVTALFTEARKSMARVGGKVALEQLTPEIKANQVVAVYYSIENDVLKLGKKVRVHLRQDNGAWTVQEVPVGPTTKADTAAKSVEWWAELVGEHGVVARVASQDKPLVDAIPGAPPPKKDGAAPPPPKKDDKKDDKKGPPTKTGAPVADKKPELTPPPKEPPPVVVAPEPKSGSKIRVLPWALVGAGAVAGGVGAYFGVKAQGERRQVTGAAVDTNGVVTGMTRAQALQLDARARSDSVVANSLIATGIGLAVAGGVVWFLGREESRP